MRERSYTLPFSLIGLGLLLMALAGCAADDAELTARLSARLDVSTASWPEDITFDSSEEGWPDISASEEPGLLLILTYGMTEPSGGPPGSRAERPDSWP